MHLCLYIDVHAVGRINMGVGKYYGMCSWYGCKSGKHTCFVTYCLNFMPARVVAVLDTSAAVH